MVGVMVFASPSGGGGMVMFMGVVVLLVLADAGSAVTALLGRVTRVLGIGRLQLSRSMQMAARKLTLIFVFILFNSYALV